MTVVCYVKRKNANGTAPIHTGTPVVTTTPAPTTPTTAPTAPVPTTTPGVYPHASNWLTVHKNYASVSVCGDCHTVTTFCSGCHSNPFP